MAGEGADPAASQTCWSAIEAGDVDYVVNRYWGVISGFLKSRLGDAHDAEEATQEFFLQVIRKDIVDRMDRTRGRARTFLFHLARQFLIDRYRARAVEDRRRLPAGAGAELIDKAAAGTDEPQAEFDRRWFQSVCDDARETVKAVFLRKSDRRSYRVFRLFHHGHGADGGRLSQDDVAVELGLSRSQVTNALRRTRRVYGQAIRNILADSCDPGEVDDEIAELLRCIDAYPLDAPPPSTIFPTPSEG